MALVAGNENPFLKLYMRQLSLNWDVLFNIQNLLSTGVKDLIIRVQDQQRLVLEEVELYTALGPRANTDEANMARTPYRTVRDAEPAPQPKETTMIERRDLSAATPYDKPEEPETKPPEEEEEKKPPEPIDFDADRADVLLDIVVKTKELPALMALNQAAMIDLVIMAVEVQEELDKRAEEARKEAEEEAAKKEKKRQERLKEVEDEKVLAEKKDREEREKAAKEREAARQKEPV